MNTEKLNRWLTLVASFGVVVGLVLLIIETRQNTDVVKAQIHQLRAEWVEETTP